MARHSRRVVSSNDLVDHPANATPSGVSSGGCAHTLRATKAAKAARNGEGDRAKHSEQG